MHLYMHNGGMLNKSKELNNMTNQEKNQAFQTLHEISLLLQDAESKFEKELPIQAKKQYASIFEIINRAESDLCNVAYQLLEVTNND